MYKVIAKEDLMIQKLKQKLYQQYKRNKTEYTNKIKFFHKNYNKMQKFKIILPSHIIMMTIILI